MRKWIYIMADKPRGSLHVGVTENLLQSVFEHRDGQTEQYGLDKLVYFEEHNVPAYFNQRERALNSLRGRERFDLIESFNPKWEDLWSQITAGGRADSSIAS